MIYKKYIGDSVLGFIDINNLNNSEKNILFRLFDLIHYNPKFKYKIE